MIKIVDYSFEHFPVEYVLCGKFQTDNLEKRFGRYRYLSGCNYHISINEILESEKKIRLQNVLKTCNTEFDLKELRNSSLTSEQDTFSVDISDFLFILETDYLISYDVDEAVKIYICGCGPFSHKKKISCTKCQEKLIKSKGVMLELDYFDYLQRAGLCIPADEIGYIYHHACAIFTYIIDHENTLKMLFARLDHKTILGTLIVESLESDVFIDLKIICECGMPHKKIYTATTFIICNILLNNFTKNKNNLCHKEKSDKKRKLLTLTS
ncbi:unnamed protein product [Acanthoscelides obtectus]|uniref:Uncharacterized protein n=1 Tax=Acanthoscelides obtectus TaxID=200917 RepID=A0A9P0LSP7_ACAOB|nr:unnamed protein product [Acanthoscelides obtectus]CAK1651335.1 hypothetical protein AOBTE_LOCUS17196 [Acanthoscelides obtectus]